MAGTVIRLRGLKVYTHPVSGITYYYHRKANRRILSEPGSPAFLAEFAKIDADEKRRQIEAAKPGTLKALILSYRSTDDFKDLAERTRQDYERVFTFLEPLYSQAVAAFTTPAIVALRDEWRRTRGRRFCNYVRTVLVLIFKRAIELGLVRDNPAVNVGKVKRDRKAPPLNRPWTEQERVAVWEATGTPRWAHLRMPVALGLCTGLREGDLIRLPKSAVADGRISVRTAKRGVYVEIPILPMVEQALREALPSDALTLCVNSKGLPWKGNGFRSGIRKMFVVLAAEGLINPGLTVHGMRHTVADVLAQAGCSHEDIAAVLGQKSSRVAAHYADKADRSERTRAAVVKLKPLARAKK